MGRRSFRVGFGRGRWVVAAAFAAASLLGALAARPADGAPSSPGKAVTRKGPRVTRIVVRKEAHTMDLFHGEEVVRHYAVAIGPGGSGPKHREGDKITPVGRYHVVQRGPSEFRIFMLLDYPNAEDRKRFAAWKADGRLPKDATIGSAIGIHGAPAAKEWKTTHKTVDWTLGCVAVDDAEIEVVASMVDDGTVVDIED
ncbi:MAG: L,D-transpeptidase family protein [Polyangiaceae bacterium]